MHDYVGRHRHDACGFVERQREGGGGGGGGGVGFHSAKIVLCKARERNGTEKHGEPNYANIVLQYFR